MGIAVAKMIAYQKALRPHDCGSIPQAFMAWLALSLFWFGYSVLWHNERRRFVFGALLSAF